MLGGTSSSHKPAVTDKRIWGRHITTTFKIEANDPDPEDIFSRNSSLSQAAPFNTSDEPPQRRRSNNNFNLFKPIQSYINGPSLSEITLGRYLGESHRSRRLPKINMAPDSYGNSSRAMESGHVRDHDWVKDDRKGGGDLVNRTRRRGRQENRVISPFTLITVSNFECQGIFTDILFKFLRS